MLASGQKWQEGIGVALTVNRLSLSAEATLLSHDSAGHQLKLNKAGAEKRALLMMHQKRMRTEITALFGSVSLKVQHCLRIVIKHPQIEVSLGIEFVIPAGFGCQFAHHRAAMGLKQVDPAERRGQIA